MDIRHIAKLAQLEVSEREAEQLGRDMEAILQLAGRLPADAGCTGRAGGRSSGPLRQDVRTPAALEEMLANAPEQSGGYLVVPKTV
ncbi:MAG: Asp-tRNA(Asn)/Glu-tRNA(Gln) amidotransferase subunit GatC [Oscillospiraceae bacterium]